jgi:hypothetical protein
MRDYKDCCNDIENAKNYVLTKEEETKWKKALKYFQQEMLSDGTSRGWWLSPDLFEAVDAWYREYIKTEEMKKNIVEKMLRDW